MNFRKIWICFKRVALILGFFVSILTIILYVFKPSPKLVAEVKISEIAIPPSIKKSLTIPERELASEEHYLKYVFDILIINKGNIVCEDISIKMRGVHEARLIKENGESFDFDLSEKKVIEVGDIKPTETVKLFAWGGPFLGAKIDLIHKHGTGKIIVKKYAPAFWQFMINRWGYLLLTFLIILFNKDLWYRFINRVFKHRTIKEK